MNEIEEQQISKFEKSDEIYQMCGIIPIDNDWNELMRVVEFIENINHKEKHYSWESTNEEGVLETYYNFAGYSVYIEGKYCGIDLNLQLDPSQRICSVSAETKFDAVLNACYQFALKYNEEKL